jgi:hypothetical protein
MKRSSLVLVALAVGACRHPSEATGVAVSAPPVIAIDSAAPASSAMGPILTTASALVAAQPSPADAPARVQAILPHWLELLERGDDATFIDEVVLPEELAKVLAGKSKAELVANFRNDKHAELVKILRAIQGQVPTKISQEPDRTLVTYDVHGRKGVTCVVVGQKIYIKN